MPETDWISGEKMPWYVFRVAESASPWFEGDGRRILSHRDGYPSPEVGMVLATDDSLIVNHHNLSDGLYPPFVVEAEDRSDALVRWLELLHAPDSGFQRFEDPTWSAPIVVPLALYRH